MPFLSFYWKLDNNHSQIYSNFHTNEKKINFSLLIKFFPFTHHLQINYALKKKKHCDYCFMIFLLDYSILQSFSLFFRLNFF